MNDPFVLESRFFESSSGIKLRYLVSTVEKSPYTLLFIHGIGGDATAWQKEQKIAHEHGISSIAVDLRGHGLSDNPLRIEEYELERLAADIVELVSGLDLKKVIVVGHSFGGMVSLMIAKEKNERIIGYILVSTNPKPAIFGLSKVSRFIAQIFPQGKPKVRPSYDKYVGTSDIHLQRLYSDISSTSVRNFLHCYSNLFKFDATKLLPSIDTPTLVICGEQDIIFNSSVAQRLAANIKNARAVLVPDANHIIVISKPIELMNAIFEFTDGL